MDEWYAKQACAELLGGRDPRPPDWKQRVIEEQRLKRQNKVTTGTTMGTCPRDESKDLNLFPTESETSNDSGAGPSPSQPVPPVRMNATPIGELRASAGAPSGPRQQIRARKSEVLSGGVAGQGSEGKFPGSYMPWAEPARWEGQLPLVAAPGTPTLPDPVVFDGTPSG